MRADRAAQSENIGSDLGRKWQTHSSVSTPLGDDGSGAVIHKGVVFWVDGNNVLHAYDASPTQDLDNDQNTDDGIPDYILGTPFDEIWNVDLKPAPAGTRVSTPTIISANSSLNASAPVDIVVVTLSNGTTLTFSTFRATQPEDYCRHLILCGRSSRPILRTLAARLRIQIMA